MDQGHSTTPTTSWSGQRTTLPGSVRRAVHKRDRACVQCGSTTQLRVDHKVNVAEARLFGWTEEQIDSMDNLQLLCDPCHDVKTRAERARGQARAKARQAAPKPRHPGLVAYPPAG